MSKRICPKCGATWPKGNFCPKDGTELQDAERPAAPDAKPKASVPPDQAATRMDSPIISAAPPKGRKAANPDARTVLDTPAIAANRPPTKRAKPKMVAPSEKQLSTASAKGDAVDIDSPAAKPARDKGFSETQWFMKGMEVDADLLEMVEDDEYDRDENISEEQRKGFTLRRDDD